jgi:hypothetical protein
MCGGTALASRVLALEVAIEKSRQASGADRSSSADPGEMSHAKPSLASSPRWDDPEEARAVKTFGIGKSSWPYEAQADTRQVR